MTTDSTELRWTDSPAWKVTRAGGARIVALAQAVWEAAPKRLIPGATEAYRGLAKAGEYGAWWADACGGDAPGVRRFLVQTPPEFWECPWEATVGALDAPRWADVSIARNVSAQTRIPQPAEFGEQLRVLVVQGAPEGDGLQRLDLKAETEQLAAAREGLDAAARALVRPIAAHAVTAANIADLLTRERPNVLWFSGHGRAEPPGLLLADGSWIAPEDLAQVLRRVRVAGVPAPLYVVLWACRTGVADRFSALRAAPPFVASLAEVGVSAVLATQAPLADDVAPKLAGAILSHLAAGRPLDLALARARGALMQDQVRERARDDWACPVVWCVDLPGDRLEWAPHTLPARRQDLARRLTPVGIEAADLSSVAYAQAGVWSRHAKVWVASPAAKAQAARAEWLARALAQQRLTERPVIVLDFVGHEEVVRGLQDWAQLVSRRAAQTDDPDRRLRMLAGQVQDDARKGWVEMCAAADLCLAVAAPPLRTPDLDWFWQGLAEAAATTMVLAENFPPARADENWHVEALMKEPVADADADALAADPATAAFAVLAVPAEPLDVEAVSPGRLEAWLETGTLIGTRSGCLMPLARAEAVTEALSPEQHRDAHRVAFEYLNGPRARAKLEEKGRHEALRRARLLHARESGWTDAVVEASQRLMLLYRDRRRAAGFLSVFEQVAPLHRRIDPTWQITAGWAFLSVGAVDEARAWLRHADPLELDDEDAADRAMLLAEAEKSSGAAGSKARAGQILRDLIASIGGDGAQRRSCLRAKHDLARLVHFIERDPASAVPMYTEIEADWQGLNAHLDRAITLRNLAEAKMALARGNPARAGSLRRQAKEHLDIARDVLDDLPAKSGHTVVAEIEYVAGRLAQDQGCQEAAIIEQFRCCRDVALDTNHMLLVAIVEARLFWIAQTAAGAGVAFDMGEWLRHAQCLKLFARHAWAARVLVDGHLRAAQRLAGSDEVRPALRLVEEAKAILDRNPAFDEGSDRRRLTVTYAGLALLGDGGWWNRLVQEHAWAADWVKDNAPGGPAPVWERRG